MGGNGVALICLADLSNDQDPGTERSGMIKPTVNHLLNRVDLHRIEERLFKMVSIPSPTGNARVMAEYYADLLRQIGLSTDLCPLKEVGS